MADDITRFIQAVGETGPDRYYVYMLCGKDGFPFYVGKGQCGRVFEHMKNAFDVKFYIDGDESLSDSERAARMSALKPKIARLIEEGSSYVPKILKWGLTEDEAFMAESTAINLASDMLASAGLPPLTNIANGHASAREKASPAGVKTCARRMESFLSECAPPVKTIESLAGRKIAFIALGHSFYSRCLSPNGTPDRFKVGECARGLWRVGLRNGKAAAVEYIVALHKMRVLGVFRVSRPATSLRSEREAGLPDFPTFPEDVRKMDYMKCAYASLAEAYAALSAEDYAELASDLEKSDPGRAPTETYENFQKRRVLFHVEAAQPPELAEYQGCVLVSKALGDKLIRRFQRNPVYLNF